MLTFFCLNASDEEFEDMQESEKSKRLELLSFWLQKHVSCI